ncbi:hypothetical protein GGE66_000475 [Rhizobium leguminosarum]|uniref:Uncharacterized protein n=1 Tax=Rhizobium leguminosarum TaxID=384 RepID=A0A7W9ZMQ1_RHILE|nr:hypothetical protein [Rhizobium leguminosarum]
MFHKSRDAVPVQFNTFGAPSDQQPQQRLLVLHPMLKCLNDPARQFLAICLFGYSFRRDDEVIDPLTESQIVFI